MTSDEARLALLQAKIKENVPGFKIIYKDQSVLHRFIGKVSFFNPRYMSDFVTVLGTEVAFPSARNFLRDRISTFKILAHEYVHLMDKKDEGTMAFSLSYIMPVPLAALALGAFAAFYSLWFLFFLTALLFLAPLPSYGRKKWEMRGYAMSMACNLWKHGSLKSEAVDWIQRCFTGSSYYFMWPFPKAVRKELNVWIRRIENGDILAIEPFQDVKTIMDMSDAEAINKARELAG
jgi:hypothetical protein